MSPLAHATASAPLVFSRAHLGRYPEVSALPSLEVALELDRKGRVEDLHSERLRLGGSQGRHETQRGAGCRRFGG